MSQQFRPSGSFSILPPVIKNLIIINVILFLLKWVLNSQGIFLDAYLALFNFDSPYFKIWQPVTHMFMHSDIGHLFFNMFGLWMFGSTVESVLGSKRFLILYFVSGFGAMFLSAFTNYLILGPNVTTVSIGASGAVYGAMFAFAYMFPNSMVLMFFFPIRAKFLIPIFIGVQLISGLRQTPDDNIGYFAHLGGMLFAFLLLYYWKRKGKLFL